MRKNVWRLLLASVIAISAFSAARAGAPIFLKIATPPPPPPPVVAKSLPIVQDQYVWPSLDNLSKLFWRLGMFKPDDQSAIDGFLLINECDIYKNYFNNDIEWSKIRTAAVRDIISNIPTYPVDFEIMIPITFGRYNTNEGYFEVTPDTALNKMHRFEAFPNRRIDICTSRIPPANYPTGLIVNIDNLITISAVPLKPDFAAYYLQGGQENLGKKRDAYIRLKVHLYKYSNNTVSNRGDLAANVTGNLEGLQIYSDPNKQHLMYDLDAQKFRREGEIVMTPFSPDPNRAAAQAKPAASSMPSPIH